jgi:gamma-glutamyl:cysteine ligase YbdK (ATP-grasp superfamily)
LDAALNHGDEVAHLIAELRTFTQTNDDWNDILSDYDADVKKWTESNPLLPYKSNEWTRITKQPLRGITSIRDASASSPVSDPIRAYIAEAVNIAKTAGNEGKLEAMREIIEKTVWDAVGYQGGLMYLSYAQDQTDGVCVSGTSQSDGTKAAWDVGAAMLIGDGYHSVLGRAQKRGAEFGTLGAAGVSKAYENIMKLLRDGQEEKTCNVRNLRAHRSANAHRVFSVHLEVCVQD